jgi:NAD+ diphosphatase
MEGSGAGQEREPVHTFAGSDLDRAAHLRSDAERVRELGLGGRGRYLPFRRLEPLVSDRDGAALVWWTDEEARRHTGGIPSEAVFLGLDGTTPCFALAVPPDLYEDPDDPSDPSEARFRGVRDVAPALPAREASIAALGRSLLGWHEAHGYCSRCGRPSLSEQAGHVRRCTGPDCGAVQFPRVDPVVIMLVHRDRQCLLGRAVRARRYPPGLYSCLAGYVEPGESIEEAVRRETREEAGLHVRRVRYHSSQPWPFPSTLMIGCFAEALPGEVRTDPAEIEEARWFSRRQLSEAVERWNEEGVVRLPPPLTIAHQLAAAWLAESPE